MQPQRVASTLGVQRRFVGLDLLRVGAVLLVLGRHMDPPPETWPGSLRAILLTWQRGGWVGVDLFLVLSGFLVSGLLFAEYEGRGHLSIGRFYIRRFWKIYPPFMVLIAATAVYQLVEHGTVDKWALLSEVTFLQNYLPGLWGHTWSLAVEEHFYLLLPCVLLVTLHFNRHAHRPLEPVLLAALGVAGVELVLRVLHWRYEPGYSHYRHAFASHLRLDTLFCGVAISYAYHFHTARFVEMFRPWRRWLIAGGVMLLSPAFIFAIETTPFIFTLGFTVFYVGSGMALIGVLLCSFPRSWLVVSLVTLGTYSYSIYLWHLPMAWATPAIARFIGTERFSVRYPIYLIGSFALGTLMSNIIEVPALRLRDRWFPSRTKAPVDVAIPGAA